MRNFLFVLALLAATTNSLIAQQEETSVLFIGNSFTFMNNMPFIFKDIAIAEGKKIHVDTVVKGGKDLNYHANNPETYKVIKSRKWDYVVIQGHSNEFAQPESKIDQNSIPYAKQIADSVRANSSCTQLVVYMTWGYKNGNSKWAPIASYDSMQYRIKMQYLRLADILDARVSPVGEVWKTIRKNYSGLNLYAPDNQHPSILGSYISACTFYATIFGASPVANKSIVPIDPATRQIIEMNVAQIVLNNLYEWRNVQKGPQPETGFDVHTNGKSIQVYDNSKNAHWIEWNFGDGHVSTEKDPKHDYASKGTYKLIQKISSNCRTLSLERNIEVK